ncbi:MAG: DNA primase [Nitrospirae bacterium]|nr:DNA primase [Nitrospirota bacterium]
MPSYDSSLEEIKSRIDIVDMISEYVSLKKAGHNWKGLCPFHAEKTPSFTVNPAKQIYRCFGCGNGGDIFTFVMQHEKIEFKEALRFLAKRAGVTLKMSSEDAGRSGEKETILKIQKLALTFFQQNLQKSPIASSYLEKRGITEEARKLFYLGYAPKSWDALKKYLEGKGFRPEIIVKSGLASKTAKGYFDMFRHRIIFPIFDLRGDVIAFGGRVMDDSEPKYLNSPETPVFNKSKALYGLNDAKKHIKEADRILLMEGYLDVIAAHMNGFTNAVAPLGTALTPEHGKLIKRFTDNVIIAFDSDQAGIKASRSAAETLFESGLDIKILSLPDKDDPDSFLKRNGKKAFGELLEKPLSVIDFLVRQKKEKRAIAREAIDTVSKISDNLLLDAYVKELSEKLGIKEVFIFEELQKMKNKAVRSPVRPDVKAGSGPARKPKPLDEAYIIKLLLQFPEKADMVFGSITEDDFKDTVTASILKKIRKGLRDFDKLMLQCDDNEKELLSEIMLKAEFDDPDKVLRDCVAGIKEKKRRFLIQELRERIRDAEMKKDIKLLRELQMRQDSLQKSGGS